MVQASSFSFFFFKANYLPIIALSSLISQSAIESLFGASLTGIAYSLFAGQPLTILGSTGPVLVFEKILFKFCKWVFIFHMTLRASIIFIQLHPSYTLHKFTITSIRVMWDKSVNGPSLEHLAPPVDHSVWTTWSKYC